jgi:hypothetical protein
MPLSLLVALVGGVIWKVVIVVHAHVSEPLRYDGWARSSSGVWFAIEALGIVGCFELAARRTRTASVGARIAGVGFSLHLAFGFVAQLLSLFVLPTYREHPDTLVTLVNLQWTTSAVIVCVTSIGLGLASGRVSVAIAGGVASLVLVPPTSLGELLYRPLETLFHVESHRAVVVFISLLGLARQVMMLVLGVVASNAPELAPDATAPPRGLDRLSRALLGRVIVKVVLAGMLPVLFILHGYGPYHSGGWWMLARITADITLFVLFARGALVVTKGPLADLPRWPFVLAAALALFAAGAMLHDVPGIIAPWIGGPEAQERSVLLGMFDPDVRTSEVLLASIAELAWSAALVCVLATIAVVARRRDQIELATRTTNRTAALIGAVLVSIGAFYLADVPGGADGGAAPAVLVLLIPAIVILVLNVLASKTCREASHAFERGPGLPTAKLLS